MRNAGLWVLILSLFFSVYCLPSDKGIAQEPDVATEGAPVLTGPEVQWLWGEVISVDTSAKQLTVKYIDYDTDNEKEVAVSVDDKTTYENIKSLDEIKPQDNVSIDYLASPEGKNIARNVSVEKIEVPSAYEEGLS